MWTKTVFILFASSVAFCGESQIKLKDGPGREKILLNCAMCHSLDYIPMNSGFLGRKGWETEVNKMVNLMGAPISKEDIPKIVEYLATFY